MIRNCLSWLRKCVWGPTIYSPCAHRQHAVGIQVGSIRILYLYLWPKKLPWISTGRCGRLESGWTKYKVTPKQMEILWFQYFRRIGLVYLLQSCRFIQVEFLQYHPSISSKHFDDFFGVQLSLAPSFLGFKTWVLQSSPGGNNKPMKTGKPIIYKPQCFVMKMVSSPAPSLMMRWKLTCTPWTEIWWMSWQRWANLANCRETNCSWAFEIS